MEWRQANPNCPGCGAVLRGPVCSYCGRPYENPGELKRDPKDDPKRGIEPRKVCY